MLKKNIFFNLLSGVAVVSIGLCPIAGYADVSQGDGDPDEVTSIVVGKKDIEKPLPTGALKADERGETSEDAVATVTAEGDFLLPTYFLPGETTVDMTSDRVSIPVVTSVQEISLSKIKTPLRDETKISQQPLTTQSKKVDMSEVQVENETADVSKVAPSEQVTPVSDIAAIEVDDIDALLAAAAAVPTIAEMPNNSPKNEPEADIRGEVSQTKPLLIPLMSKKVEVKKDVEVELPKRIRAVAPSAFADEMLAALDNGRGVPFRMPHEMKISFYPNASSFSGQSLKWVKAFAKTALLDPRLIVEVRVSHQNAPLQDKRLLLIQNTLKGVGLSAHQINIIFVERPQDTILLRAISKPQPDEVVSDDVLKKKNDKKRRVTKW